MNYKFLEEQIEEHKDNILHFAKQAKNAMILISNGGSDIDYQKHQMKIYESIITESEDLLDIFYTARDLAPNPNQK